MRKKIHLNESELNNLVKESVRRVLRESMNEIGDTYKGQYALGAASARESNRNPKYDEHGFFKPGNRFSEYAFQKNKNYGFNDGYDDYLRGQNIPEKRQERLINLLRRLIKKYQKEVQNDPDLKDWDENKKDELVVDYAFSELSHRDTGVSPAEYYFLNDYYYSNDYMF